MFEGHGCWRDKTRNAEGILFDGVLHILSSHSLLVSFLSSSGALFCGTWMWFSWLCSALRRSAYLGRIPALHLTPLCLHFLCEFADFFLPWTRRCSLPTSHQHRSKTIDLSWLYPAVCCSSASHALPGPYPLLWLPSWWWCGATRRKAYR